MELKKGSQTGKPKSAEVSLNVEGMVPQLLSGSRSNSKSVPKDPEEIDNSRISTAAEKEVKYDVSNEALYQLEEYFQSTSSSSTSHISSVTTHESSSSTSRISSVTQETRSPKKHPPPIQVMDKRSSFDSGRSIFAKPATVMGWSIVSNESLFSIQIGKESFARDHGFTLEELDNSADFSIDECSYSFRDLNELEESIKSDDKLYQPEKVSIPKENEEKPQHALSKTNIEEFEDEQPNQALSRENSSKSSCSNSGCTLCGGFSMSSCCSCKCFSFPTCRCDSWPSCSGKNSCWSDCSSCGCKPSTWEWCKCRCPTWSIEKIFCCLSSKSSAKFPSGSRKDSDTDAKNWCTRFSRCSWC